MRKIKVSQRVKNLSYICLIAFLIGVFTLLGQWAVAKVLDFFNMLAVG